LFDQDAQSRATGRHDSKFCHRKQTIDKDERSDNRQFEKDHHANTAIPVYAPPALTAAAWLAP
jgi:hypothetical protein